VIYFVKRKINKILLIVAHGENWEVAAAHTVNDMIKKIMTEEAANKHSERRGTLDLLYTPANVHGKPIIVPLLNRNSVADKPPENNPQQVLELDQYFKKVEHV